MSARALALLALALAGCATLDTSGMSGSCRDGYNLCLDGCPKPAPNLSTNPSDAPLDFDTPNCVDTCNKQARSCR